MEYTELHPFIGEIGVIYSIRNAIFVEDISTVPPPGMILKRDGVLVELGGTPKSVSCHRTEIFYDASQRKKEKIRHKCIFVMHSLNIYEYHFDRTLDESIAEDIEARIERKFLSDYHITRFMDYYLPTNYKSISLEQGENFFVVLSKHSQGQSKELLIYKYDHPYVWASLNFSYQTEICYRIAPYTQLDNNGFIQSNIEALFVKESGYELSVLSLQSMKLKVNNLSLYDSKVIVQLQYRDFQ